MQQRDPRKSCGQGQSILHEYPIKERKEYGQYDQQKGDITDVGPN